MNKIPVGATIAYAYRFAFGQAPTLLRAIWLPLLLQLVLAFFLIKRSALLFAAMNAQDPSATTLVGPVLLLVPVIIILFFVQLTAAMETALGNPPRSWFTFRLDKPMWRLLGGFVITALIITAAMIGYLMVLYVVAFLAEATLKASVSAGTARSLAILIAAGVVLVAYGGVIFLAVRFLFLTAPISVAQRQIGLTQAWHLSAGNFWRILLIALAILIPILIVNYAFTLSLTGLPPAMPGASKQAREAAEAAWRVAEMNAMAERWYLTLPLSGVLLLFQFGAGCAAQVFAYRALTESKDSAPVAGG
jgi:hypothetical protein